jgi:cytochrome c oxidase assembly protein subunit 16
MSSLLARISNNKHFKNGVPFFLFIFGGAYALREFRSVRYDSDLNPKAKKLIKPEDLTSELAKRTDKVTLEKTAATLEEDLDKLYEKVDLENWENKRGPRPWEAGSIKDRPVRRFVHEAPTLEELTRSNIGDKYQHRD